MENIKVQDRLYTVYGSNEADADTKKLTVEPLYIEKCFYPIGDFIFENQEKLFIDKEFMAELLTKVFQPCQFVSEGLGPSYIVYDKSVKPSYPNTFFVLQIPPDLSLIFAVGDDPSEDDKMSFHFFRLVKREDEVKAYKEYLEDMDFKIVD